MSTAPQAAAAPLRHLQPGWYALVMGLTGLSLAWHQAVHLLGELAVGVSRGIGALALMVFVVLLLATLLRLRRHADAWGDDRRHPVRHTFVATLPVSVILLATATPNEPPFNKPKIKPVP